MYSWHNLYEMSFCMAQLTIAFLFCNWVSGSIEASRQFLELILRKLVFLFFVCKTKHINCCTYFSWVCALQYMGVVAEKPGVFMPAIIAALSVYMRLPCRWHTVFRRLWNHMMIMRWNFPEHFLMARVHRALFSHWAL